MILAAAEPPTGLAHLIALAVAGGIFYLVTVVVGRFKVDNSSPTPQVSDTGQGDTSQLSEVSDTDDTSDTRVVRYGDGVYAISYDDGRNHTAVKVHRGQRPPVRGELDRWVGLQLAAQQRTEDIVAGAQRAWRVSRSTVMRALRRARTKGASR